MEIFNIKSSAALIYDEFIQKAGKYHQWESHLINCWSAMGIAASFTDMIVTLCRPWQTPGRRTGSSCRPHSPKPSSSRRTSTLWRRWGPASWRTARPSTSRGSWWSTTSVSWRCRFTWSMRWVAFSLPARRWRVCAAPVFLVLLGTFCQRRLVSGCRSEFTEWNFLWFERKLSPLPAQPGWLQHSNTLVSRSSLELSRYVGAGGVGRNVSLVHI